MLARREFLGKATKTAAGLFVVSLFDDLFPEIAEAAPRIDFKRNASKQGRLLLDISELILRLYEKDKLIKTYPVAVGKKRDGRSYTRTGNFSIFNIVYHPAWEPPTYVVNDEMKKVISENGGVIPYGHRLNPFKGYFMGFDGRRGFHGTTKPESIGTYASLCVRMYEKDSINLAENHSYPKMPVKVVA